MSTRTRYVYRPKHPKASELGFVSIDDLGEDLHEDGRAPLFTDRFMENDRAPDGSDISSRQKRKAWMAATGSADYNDFTETRAEARKTREQFFTDGGDWRERRERREQLGRTAYELSKRRR